MLLTGVLLAASLAAPAAQATPEGHWAIPQHGGVIAIEPCPAGLCGRIVGMSDTRTPEGKLPADTQGTPMCGLTILRVHREAPDHWAGIIRDPKTGTDWHCTLRMGEDGSLKLRGYVLTPLLGHTMTWTPYAGRLGSDCAMTG